jgi:hypothetical protein
MNASMKTVQRRGHRLIFPLAALIFLSTGLFQESGRSGRPDRLALAKSPPEDYRAPLQLGTGTAAVPTYDWSDRRVTREIMRHLKSRGLLDHAYLVINVEDGMVSLAGNVASTSERRRAIETAWVPSVRHVDASRLIVVPRLLDHRKPPGTDRKQHVLSLGESSYP